MMFTIEEFKEEYSKKFLETVSKPMSACSQLEKYGVLVKLVTSSVSKVRAETLARQIENREKQVYYFSMEFLIGRLLENYLINLGIRDVVADGLKEMGEDLDALCSCEQDPALGNGGLGRLAACFLDSMAFLGVPGTGNGVRYRFGLFQQHFENGYQVEGTDNWLENGYPWETRRPEHAVEVHFGGYVERRFQDGELQFTHRDYQRVLAVPYDVPIVGYGGQTVNTLRLWSAEPAKEEFDLNAFNNGDYAGATRARSDIEAITWILYPQDTGPAGRSLRLKQEYFFVSAGIQSILRQYKRVYGAAALMQLPEHVCIQINDTHPALCGAELIRLLIDEEGLSWDQAWQVATHTCAYTNHTVMPEALETWDISLVQQLLPRLYMIIEEIDRRYREGFDQSQPNAREKLAATAILWDGKVRMANLSILCGYSVNGVAALHTDILKKDVLRSFYELTPEKFNNKTNGVSHRRFLIQSNPGLTRLITSAIGDGWKRDAQQLEQLLPLQSDAAFLQQLQAVKRENKCRLADFVAAHNGIVLDPDSIFDVQVKRIHAYKRQLLSAFKILRLYNCIKENPSFECRPCTFIFGGKAAQSYVFAKECIKLLNSIADLVNNDPDVRGRIKVVFVENFNVSNAQLIYPAADISEQISTAGKEASGTGCMKFMMNGALTLGTLDGANIEIRNLVGPENFQVFGLTSDECMNYYLHGGYSAQETARQDPALQQMVQQLVNGFLRFSGQDYWNIYDALMQQNDEYFVLKDFAAYMDAWQQLCALYDNTALWQQKALVNIAKSGYFSSDRTIREYVRDIWHTRCDN